MTTPRSSDKPPLRISRDQSGGPLYELELQGRPERLPVGAPRLALNSSNVARLKSNRFYVYIVDRAGQCVVYDRPLRPVELIRGAYHNKIAIKHPMLVDQADCGVRAAGDMCVLKDPSNKLLGMLANRASGHFRPTLESIPSIVAAGQTLGLRQEQILVV